MSLAIRPPRRSALGVTWCEDFRRGRLGVRKNQGTIMQTPPSVVGFDGKWASFPGDADVLIQYPQLRTAGRTAFTAACRTRGVTIVDHQALICMYGAVGGDVFLFDLGSNSKPALHIAISGVTRWVEGAVTDWTVEHDVLVTWSTGDYIRMYVDGLLSDVSGAAYAGAMDEVAQPLRLGVRNSDDYPLDGDMADPLVDLTRAWSAAEVMAYHNRSTFI